MRGLSKQRLYHCLGLSLFLLLAGPLTYADGSKENGSALLIREVDHHSALLLGADLVQLQTPKGSLQGAGLTLGYQYGLSSTWALRPHVSQVFGLSGSSHSLYTSFGAMAEYALTGSFTWGSTAYESRGLPIAKLTSTRKNTWLLGLGFEQLFLSGTVALYSAPGFTGLVAYHFLWNQHPYGLELKFGEYSSGNKPFTGTTLNVLSYFDI
jgi:hypothetical protein